MNRLSLRLRLIAGFALLTLICWSVASLLSWYQTRHNINELFDTQQMLFAKRLATMNPDELQIQSTSLPKTKSLVHKNRGKQDDDALAFAIFTRNGKMVLNDGDNGKDFIFDSTRNGFTDGKLRDDNDAWRIVWLTTEDNRYVIAVGQEWEYRQDMTLDIVKTNLMPWLFALPIMLALLFWLVTRELSPLKRIAAELQLRSPDESTPLATQRIPQEVLPLVNALNLLFSRIHDMLTRERRFTSDAAHELRSPLAALKVQTEVAQLAHDDEAMRRHALMNLDKGIDRATRLVDQLLTLSRLDAESHPEGMQPVQFNELLQQAVIAHYHTAQTAGIELTLDLPNTPIIRQGHPLLLTLLVRNLLDNAIRYSHEGGIVSLTLTERGFQVADNGPGISDEALARIGERFYRPPGQEKSGSGLGISIVNNIAMLHQMRVTFTNQPEGGLIVSVNW
ncbi:two-component system sensor kinase [Pectobacterium atrosepticum SCRI1043]|uniref:Sensor protein QseC n=1 Tax=Pectobacterium atrosepticum (strain SCRI 1043 / ATCC BAA-672) TaxID=218491 RepID=Q6DB91_PECAS|nr:quorum sensing histidine kinase QseC [Pectobacterium atrosepticum]GKV87968.1 two-component sensor histidine kinase [Pectobacterium carotovorum subsp. carotovorum]ATY88885.1 two-component system sensor histidine kinase QseC [Pectobacterium atrosepticum]KFX22863.1 sensor protein QseC [Pectobacterium atrosepticum]MBL0895070.1 two-component system sensor histidine kinase QseC [Pectobacterium atrosepticum]MCA6978529.1 two-component system sensor histidine kinase QseC [Pectobacterium atrosepticum